MKPMLGERERLALLCLAREAIAQYLRDGSRAALPEGMPALEAVCGAFVTLHRGGELRGCIGSMIGRAPLGETVREMAIAAATEDPRFDSLHPEELSEIDIEISVLSPLKRVRDAGEIQVGVHGILLRRGMRQGVLLPQVATEWGWNREEFLRQTCRKAGLPADAWQDPETVIEIFSAQVFGEEEGLARKT